MYWPCIYTVHKCVHIAMHGLCGVLSIYCNSPISIQNTSEVVEYPYSGQFLKEHDVPCLGTDELQHETIQANISDNVCRYQCLLQYTYTDLLIDRTPLAYISLWARSQEPVICYTHIYIHTYNNVRSPH